VNSRIGEDNLGAVYGEDIKAQTPYDINNDAIFAASIGGNKRGLVQEYPIGIVGHGVDIEELAHKAEVDSTHRFVFRGQSHTDAASHSPLSNVKRVQWN
jgi:hypothetical protein